MEKSNSFIASSYRGVDYWKRYGFIEPSDGSRDLFLHIRAIERAGIETLEPGQRVSFEIERLIQNWNKAMAHFLIKFEDRI